jgi:chemotaxis protein CheC
MSLMETADCRLAGLKEFFASATHDASAAMCRWTEGVITVELDELRQVPLQDVAFHLGVGDQPLTMVVMTLDGELGGSMILMFNDCDGRQLAASLLGCAPSGGPEWSDLERSALMETGNILGCAYVNALTRLIGTDLRPSVPYFLQDYGASVLQQALMSQAATSDDFLLCDIGFHDQGDKLDWRVVFVPTPGLQDSLLRSLSVTTKESREYA